VAFAQKLANSVGRSELTCSEPEFLMHIVYGKSNEEIGTELSLCRTTVKSHLNNLLRQLRVSDRSQAVSVAIQRGFVSIESLNERVPGSHQ